MPFTAAPGSIVLVRDAEWVVTKVEQTADGHFVHVIGLSELVRDTEATFSTAIDDVLTVDPAQVSVVPDKSPSFRRSRLWLEATLRKTPIAASASELSVARQGLSDPLDYHAFVIGPDGHVQLRYDLYCATEADAIERAKQLVDGHDIELWHRDKKIATFKHGE